MRPARSRLAALVLATLSVPFLAAPAHASGCPLLSDAAGDGQWRAAPAVSSPALDILSADAATGATTLVVVLRLGALPSDGPGDVFAASTSWTVGWNIGSTSHGVRAFRTTTGYRSEYSAGGTTSAASLVADATSGTLTWTVPRSAASDLATPGVTLDRFRAFSAFLGSTADIASDLASTYTDGTPGCVPAA